MLLLTIFSGIAMLVFLLVLGWALERISRALEGVTGNLEKIAAGVRAIERETAPLGTYGNALNSTLAELSTGFESINGTLRRVA